MIKKQCAIVIPVYKRNMSEYECISFIQCLKILRQHDIFIVSHKDVFLDEYVTISEKYCKSLNYLFFDSFFFNGIEGYNKLLMNISFYNSFNDYDYILIYQLDAFVFKDTLCEWCNCSFDYIGAPWFEGFNSFEDGYNLWKVGNGGFSLRKVDYFIKVLSWRFPVRRWTLNQLLKARNFGLFLSVFGWKNNIDYFINNTLINEDVFYCVLLESSWIPPKTPSPIEASKFSFEKSPSYLFKLNQYQLPFGCHAFLKNEFDSFWKYFIMKETK